MAGEVVFLGGPSGVGKTSVGLEMHAQLAAADVAHCVIEGDFLDLAHPTPWNHQLAERNLAAMWSNYRALGYSRLIYTNTVSVLPNVMDALLAAMGGDLDPIAVLLTCNEATRRERLRQREKGSELERHLESSAQTATSLAANISSTVHRVSTDARSISAIATEILQLSGWLPGTNAGCP